MTYLFATYSVIFIFIFAYLLLINKRYEKQKMELESLKDMIHELNNRNL